MPYPSSSAPTATVKSGGCGPTCAAMIVSNLTDKLVDPKAMAAYAIKIGARVSGGTDMNKLSKTLAADYGLTLNKTNDETALLAHLKAGGMAIANVGGDRPGYTGVFSDEGHYIIVAGLNTAGKLVVLDPGNYTDKYNKTGRTGKVIVQGDECSCDISVLGKDTENREPAYYLFARKAAQAVIDNDAITIQVGGKKIEGKLIGDTAYAPVRVIAEVLGKTVTWDGTTNSVIIK